MEKRLEQTFARRPRQPTADEKAVMGFKKRRKEELLDALCTAYASAPLTRKCRRVSGVHIPETLTAALLAALKLVDWSQNTRPGVESSGYITLKEPPPLRPPRDPRFPTPKWPENDPRLVRRRVWDAAAALLCSIPAATSFEYT